MDIREYVDGRPTKKGVKLPLRRWVSLKFHEAVFKENLEKVKKGEATNLFTHIGGNIYVTVKNPYWCVDIREFYLREDGEMGATQKGIRFRQDEWGKLCKCFADLEVVLPELKSTVPCYLEDSHQNQLGMLCFLYLVH